MPYLALLVGIFGVSYIVKVWKSRPLLKPAELPNPIEGEELEHFRRMARRETEI
jgi:hypothetical protein